MISAVALPSAGSKSGKANASTTGAEVGDLN